MLIKKKYFIISIITFLLLLTISYGYKDIITEFKINRFVNNNFNDPDKYESVSFGKIEDINYESIERQLKNGKINDFWASYDRSGVMRGAVYKKVHNFRYEKYNNYHRVNEKILITDVFYFNKDFKIVFRVLQDFKG